MKSCHHSARRDGRGLSRPRHAAQSQVAIKVLPELFAADAERIARFTREAQTLAALNHPNIAQIYGLEGTAGPAVRVRW